LGVIIPPIKFVVDVMSSGWAHPDQKLGIKKRKFTLIGNALLAIFQIKIRNSHESNDILLQSILKLKDP
jgi:hypothetical protein